MLEFLDQLTRWTVEEFGEFGTREFEPLALLQIESTSTYHDELIHSQLIHQLVRYILTVSGRLYRTDSNFTNSTVIAYDVLHCTVRDDSLLYLTRDQIMFNHQIVQLPIRRVYLLNQRIYVLTRDHYLYQIGLTELHLVNPTRLSQFHSHANQSDYFYSTVTGLSYYGTVPLNLDGSIVTVWSARNSTYSVLLTSRQTIYQISSQGCILGLCATSGAVTITHDQSCYPGIVCIMVDLTGRHWKIMHTDNDGIALYRVAL